MSDCLLRGAEAVALDASDIAFEDGWLCVEVRRSKTDREGRGVVLYAGVAKGRRAPARAPGSPNCPEGTGVVIWWALPEDYAPSRTHQPFRSIDGSQGRAIVRQDVPVGSGPA